MQHPWEIEWRDYYEILQLSPSADEDVISWTCKKLRSKYHTDRESGDEVKIRLVNEAYAVLSEPQQRKLYDAAYKQKQSQNQKAAELLQTEQQLRAAAEQAKQQESQRRKELEQELNQLRNANTQTTASSTHQAPGNAFTAHGYDLSGDWISSEGYLHRIWQTGKQLRVQGIDAYGRVFSDGAGQIEGQNVRWRYQTLPIQTPPYGLMVHQGEVTVQLSLNGGTLQGQASNFSLGQTVSINFRRQS